jgi:hypothetical protein
VTVVKQPYTRPTLKIHGDVATLTGGIGKLSAYLAADLRK